MTRLGIAVGGPLRDLGRLARRCEELGFDSLWVPETARTAYVSAAVAIAATERVRVGTSIALAFPRSPVITAMEARDLAELSGGRFVLGLGTQVKRVNELRYATPFEHPAPRMREIVEVCRAVWGSFGGSPIDHRGRFYTVTMAPFPGAGPPPSRIPIHVAAVNREMLRLAGDVCDGFLGHPLTSARYLAEVARPGIAEGIARAGRAPADVEIVQSLIVSVSSDRAAAFDRARMQIAFYATTRTYRPVLDLHGFGDLVDPLRAAHARGDIAEMIRVIPDEMVETYAVAGTPDEARDKIARYEGLADELVLNPPWADPAADRGADAYEHLLRTFRAG